MYRRKAFEKSPPAGWKPEVWDEVFLPPGTPFKNNARAIVVIVLAEDIVKVRYSVRGYATFRQLLISELRPTGRVFVPNWNEFREKVVA